MRAAICRMVIGAAVSSGMTACATPRDPEIAIDPIVVNQVLTSAASQIRQCYRAPRVSSLGKQIITRIVVRLNADGTLAGLPEVVAQSGVTPDNQSEAGRMAEAASLAVIRCSPLRLPPEHYGAIWETFELTFSPRARV